MTGLFSYRLPDLDSNQDFQIQKLTYYPYTIGQECAKVTIPMGFIIQSSKKNIVSLGE